MQRGLLLTSSGGFRLLDRTSDMVFGLNRKPAFERRMQPLDIHGLQQIHIYANHEAAFSLAFMASRRGEGSQVGASG
jgi:hypothetical protein